MKAKFRTRLDLLAAKRGGAGYGPTVIFLCDATTGEPGRCAGDGWRRACARTGRDYGRLHGLGIEARPRDIAGIPQATTKKRLF
jgi:hypothetical protein